MRIFFKKYMYLGALMETIINRQFAYNEKYYQPAHMSVSRRRVLSNSVLLFGGGGRYWMRHLLVSRHVSYYCR